MTNTKDNKKAEDVLSKFIEDCTENLKKISKALDILSIRSNSNPEYVKRGLEVAIRASQNISTIATKNLDNLHNFYSGRDKLVAKAVEDPAPAKESPNHNNQP